MTALESIGGVSSFWPGAADTWLTCIAPEVAAPDGQKRRSASQSPVKHLPSGELLPDHYGASMVRSQD